MQNIDPVYFATPVVAIVFSFGAAVYWRQRRRLTFFVLGFSLIAYFGAILAKYALQTLTYGPFESAVGGAPAALGVYFGLQTSLFEVGGAYLVARYAFTRGTMKANDAEGYGISLALWENGVLLGGSALLNYAIYYATLSAGSGAAAEQMLAQLLQAAPSLFDPPSKALSLVGYSILERVSSLLLHFSWGYLCVLAVVFKKRSLLLVALPMGFADALVPFAGELGAATFEAILFAIGLASVAASLRATRGPYRSQSVDFASTPQPGAANLRMLFVTAFRRALSFGKVYVGMGMVLPLLFVAEFTVTGKAVSNAGAAAPAVLGEVFPLLLPLFMVLGATGGLMIFASDREKGVYEYMIAYGVDVSTIFLSIVVATAGLVTLVLAVALAVSLVSIVALGGTITVLLVELLVLYTVPLSYASAIFMAMVGMIWSQLTARRPGVNSPVGMAPILGIAPVFVTLLAAVGPGAAHILFVVGGASGLMFMLVLGMAWVANEKMERERFIANA